MCAVAIANFGTNVRILFGLFVENGPMCTVSKRRKPIGQGMHEHLVPRARFLFDVKIKPK